MFLEHREVQHVLSDENFLCHLDDLVFSVLIKNNNVVDVRTVTDVLVLFEPCSDESLLTVDEQFLVSLDDGGSLNGVEVANLGTSRMFLPLLVRKELEPVGSDLNHIGEVAVDVFNLRFYTCHDFVSLVLVELQYALHFNFE